MLVHFTSQLPDIQSWRVSGMKTCATHRSQLYDSVAWLRSFRFMYYLLVQSIFIITPKLSNKVPLYAVWDYVFSSLLLNFNKYSLTWLGFISWWIKVLKTHTSTIKVYVKFMEQSKVYLQFIFTAGALFINLSTPLVLPSIRFGDYTTELTLLYLNSCSRIAHFHKELLCWRPRSTEDSIVHCSWISRINPISSQKWVWNILATSQQFFPHLLLFVFVREYSLCTRSSLSNLRKCSAIPTASKRRSIHVSWTYSGTWRQLDISTAFAI